MLQAQARNIHQQIILQHIHLLIEAAMCILLLLFLIVCTMRYLIHQHSIQIHIDACPLFRLSAEI